MQKNLTSQVGSGKYHTSRASGRSWEVDRWEGQSYYTSGWSPGSQNELERLW